MENTFVMKRRSGILLVVQWSKLAAFSAGAAGSIPEWGTEISHATGCSQKNGKKEKGLMEIRATFLGVQDCPEQSRS